MCRRWCWARRTVSTTCAPLPLGHLWAWGPLCVQAMHHPTPRATPLATGACWHQPSAEGLHPLPLVTLSPSLLLLPCHPRRSRASTSCAEAFNHAGLLGPAPTATHRLQPLPAPAALSPQALAGIDILRKICNHADLLERTKSAAQQDYGACLCPASRCWIGCLTVRWRRRRPSYCERVCVCVCACVHTSWWVGGELARAAAPGAAPARSSHTLHSAPPAPFCMRTPTGAPQRSGMLAPARKLLPCSSPRPPPQPNVRSSWQMHPSAAACWWPRTSCCRTATARHLTPPGWPPPTGAPERSGKLAVARKLLSHWSGQGHKTLVFCQTQQMLDIVEKMAGQLGLAYHRCGRGRPAVHAAVCMCVCVFVHSARRG